MLLKCPRCDNRGVLEEQIDTFAWKRRCIECFFVYTIRAEICDESLDEELLEAAREYQLELL